MNIQDKIFIAGHKGMVGSAIQNVLIQNGYKNLVTVDKEELDLRNQQEVNLFFQQERPDYVFLAAAKVGGILANNMYKADFLYENICIQSNVIHAAYLAQVQKLLFLGSSCIYPKMAQQPIKEESLLTGLLEPTNEPYAIAKIAGIKMCDAYREQYGCNFISAMPTNLYGPNDNYNLETSHVLPALIRKIYTAKYKGEKDVNLWGSGNPLREFLHVNDLAKACLFLMDEFDSIGPINIGSGNEISIKNLAQLIAKIVRYDGRFSFDTTKPDGTPRKILNSQKINDLGWDSKISLEDGILSVLIHLEKENQLSNWLTNKN